MEIVAKSAANYSELCSRKQLGFKKIELQLLGKDKEMLQSDPMLMISQIMNSGIDVVAIHTPLGNMSPFNELNLEYLSEENYRHLFLDTCAFAQSLSSLYEKKIRIIIHNGLTISQYKVMPALYDNIVKLFADTILYRFPDLIFSLENITPIKSLAHANDELHFTNGIFADGPEIARQLNIDLGRSSDPLFTATLDTCHMLTSMRILEALRQVGALNPNYIAPTIDKYVGQYYDIIDNVHLNNFKNFGVNQGEHSAPFDSSNNEDILFLKHLLSILPDKVPLTLEINETDYTNCPNLMMTQKAIKKIMPNITI